MRSASGVEEKCAGGQGKVRQGSRRSASAEYHTFSGSTSNWPSMHFSLTPDALLFDLRRTSPWPLSHFSLTPNTLLLDLEGLFFRVCKRTNCPPIVTLALFLFAGGKDFVKACKWTYWSPESSQQDKLENSKKEENKLLTNCITELCSFGNIRLCCPNTSWDYWQRSGPVLGNDFFTLLYCIISITILYSTKLHP